MGSPDGLVVGTPVFLLGVVLHNLPDQSSLRVKHRQTSTNFWWEVKQIKLKTDLAMITLLSLFKPDLSALTRR